MIARSYQLNDRTSKSLSLRTLLRSGEPQIILEAHDALSARIVERSGLAGIWASSLTISATWGKRDANELSWTQVVDVLEHMTDATNIPILADGDSGHGNFNTVRQFVRRLSACGVAGVCIEDQQFPKENSLLDSEHTLATIAEFSGKIRAAKDSQSHDSFVVVARVEALIAGLGMDEALRRAEAYHLAGADAVLVHSKRLDASEVLQFAAEWGDRCPLIIVPTTYATVPMAAYQRSGISAVIWANHTLRAAISAMRHLCEFVKDNGSPAAFESQIAGYPDLFELTNHAELVAARARYAAPASTRLDSTISAPSDNVPE